jgi:hypothetical protein
MINVSAAFKTALEDDNRNFSGSCTITLTSGKTMMIDNSQLWDNGFVIDDSTSNTGSFDIGSAIIQKFTLRLNNIYDDFTDYDFTGAEISDVKVSLLLDSGKMESVQKGIYTVNETSYNGDIITLECLDNMHKFDTGYSVSNLAYPATLFKIVQDACGCCGVTLATDSLQFEHYDYVISEKPEDSAMTFRDILTWVGQISGHFWKCNSKGQLTAGWYNMSDLSANTNIHFLQNNVVTDITADTDDVVITCVRVVTEDENSNQVTYQSGSDGYTVVIDNNKLITNDNAADITSMIGERVVGLRFRPMTVSTLQDPTIEAGDGAIVYDRKLKSYKTFFTNVVFSIDADNQMSNDAEPALRNSAERFSEATRIYQDLIKRLNKNKTEWVKAMESLQNAMDEKEGLHPVTEELEDGSRILYFCDHATLEESKVVIKLNAEGWGMSTDGGKTWNVGALVDGTTITKILNAIGINADWINTGAITIKDPQGNVIFQADMDTKRVTMSGESVRLGKSSLKDKMASLENDVALSRNMTMTLTNDFQTITTNASIPPGTFPDVSTQAIVMYGSQDITKECSFTITKSDAVSGNWDEATATYTVTGITEDSAWVDIKATYLSTLSVTKRFGISKIKAESGRTYFIEPSCNVLKRSADNTMSPNFIEFKAYYRDGTSTTRTAYNGRFVIEETKDGNTWTTLYTSSADENTVKHYLYSIPVDGSSQAISDSTTMIGIPRDVTNIRCRLYAAGGTTTLMDMESVAVVVDVDALTHEEIFDLLTNKGMIKGIYKEGDQIYISFTYAKGGTLALGGVGNGNGKLIILDASGNQVGYIDNTGVNFEKGTFTGILSATSGDIGGWIIDKANGTLKSANGKIVLNSKDDRITINGVPIRAYGNGVIIDGGLTIRTGSDDFSDGTDSFQLYNISTLTSGNYLRLYNNGVFQSSSSSKRYKEIGQDISEKDIDPWYNIQPVWAKYKDGYLMKNDSRNGIEFPMFVAEDVEEYFPLAVDHLEDGKAENWNERIMIPAMFAMLKFQKQKIDILENEITEIKKLLEEKKE